MIPFFEEERVCVHVERFQRVKAVDSKLVPIGKRMQFECLLYNSRSVWLLNVLGTEINTQNYLPLELNG